jgi:hypothetical protein
VLLGAKIKLRRGGGLGRRLIQRLNGPEVLPALSDKRHAPASQFGGSKELFGIGTPWHAGKTCTAEAECESCHARLGASGRQIFR